MFFFAVYFIQHSTVLQKDTINGLTDNNFKIEKLFITIQVEAKSYKNEDHETYERWSYAHVS